LQTVHLLLGSNKGNRQHYLQQARCMIQQYAGFIRKISSVYATDAWGNIHQPKYLNQALIIQTNLTPFQLLKTLQKIEKELGRTNKHHYSARTIDIDILFFEGCILKAKNLEIPHPRLHLRNFTLLPLLEIDKSYTHPVIEKTIEELVKNSADNLKVSIFETKEKYDL
jgi:2-amino-4-hydroxy-6-hydroxymethyldihydropteridine diphosphokinase